VTPYCEAGFTKNSLFVVHTKAYDNLINVGDVVKLHKDDGTLCPLFIVIETGFIFYSGIPTINGKELSTSYLKYIGEDEQKEVKEPQYSDYVDDVVLKYIDTICCWLCGLQNSAARMMAKAEYIRKVHMSAERIIKNVDADDVVDFRIDVFKAVIKMLQHIKANDL